MSTDVPIEEFDMPTKPNIKEILKNNPKVDVAKLREGIRMLKELQEAGLEIPRHRVVPAHARKELRLERNPMIVIDHNA